MSGSNSFGFVGVEKFADDVSLFGAVRHADGPIDHVRFEKSVVVTQLITGTRLRCRWR